MNEAAEVAESSCLSSKSEPDSGLTGAGHQAGMQCGTGCIASPPVPAAHSDAGQLCQGGPPGCS
jgi:hypothetical protein